ncbi:MAG TPA: hypothetical protein VFR78_10035 [Pyrinomonadaceae bacterium]|nr:hypothetical protein [Pyrinomonadaceae bacterium]
MKIRSRRGFSILRVCVSVARIRGLETVVVFVTLGLTPQALCLRLLRRLTSMVHVHIRNYGEVVLRRAA